MDINPQYTFDKLGNPIGVFLPIEEWNNLTEELHMDIPQWQKDLIDMRLAEYKNDPGNVLNWDDVIKEFDKEDGLL
jgi:hypothetical protein